MFYNQLSKMERSCPSGSGVVCGSMGQHQLAYHQLTLMATEPLIVAVAIVTDYQEALRMVQQETVGSPTPTGGCSVDKARNELPIA